MRSSLLIAVVAAGLLLASVEGSLRSTPGATNCAGTFTPTVTFQTTCNTISSSDASCWSPHLPGASDVVLFPAATKATAEFANVFTPLSAQTVVVASGAVITMNGGSIAVSQCLQVAGKLTLLNVAGDNGTISTMAYQSDPSVPLGTDCSAVPRGFSPRICGPGEVYVSGTLTVSGLFASLFAKTTVAVGATLQFGDQGFLWGNVTNFGSVSAPSMMFFHGFLMNAPGGTASFGQIRADYWTVTPRAKNVTVSAANFGTMNLNIPLKNGDPNFEYVSSRDEEGDPFVTFLIENHQQLNVNAPLRGGRTNTWGMIAFDLINTGTTTFRGLQSFNGVGSCTNYGVLIANMADVWYQSYVSHGGTQQTENGGNFYMGMTDEKIEALKSRGVRGPYIGTAELTNSRIVSADGTGEVKFAEPMLVEGDLIVGQGATLRNKIPFATSAQLRGSTGALRIHGRYAAGASEHIAERHSAVVVERSGTFEVPTHSVVRLQNDASLEVVSGAVVRVDGHIRTATGPTDAPSGLSVSSLAFVTGKGLITGDFSLEMTPMEA